MLSFCCVDLVLCMHGLLFSGFFHLNEMIVFNEMVAVVFDSFLQSRETLSAISGVLQVGLF